jgi:asparagine synthase (glutamine-hydrolysing)
MLRRMCGADTSDATGSHLSASAALGWLGRHGQQSSCGIATLENSTIAFDGELYTTPAGSRPVGREAAASALLEGYLREGRAYLAQVEGRFAAAIWDDRLQQCVLITDKFGSKPLYFAPYHGGLAFASEIKSLLALPGASSELNSRGLAQFLTFGHLWNNDTFYRSIQSLDAATCAVYKTGEAAPIPTCYWRPGPSGTRRTAESLAELDARLKAAEVDRTTAVDHLGVSLSGGLDARTLLGLMEPAAVRPKCVSLGMEGSLDQRSAQRLAELAGCEYHTFVLGQGFLADFERHLQRMVDLTDGHYLSQCIVMPTLPLYEQLGVHSLVRGHAGELVHMHKAYNFSVDGSFSAVRDHESLYKWLLPRLQSHLIDGVPEPIVRGMEHRDLTALADESLRTALRRTEQWEHPVDAVSQLFLDQRTRRETAMSLVKFNSIVDLRLPYLDGRFVEAVFASPPELRVGESIQTYILRSRRPDFLAPPNSNTGAPVGATWFRREFCYYKMRVLAKLGVRGYQPYERLGLWLRRELRPVVEGLLLSPACLDRGVLEPDAVRNVVSRHVNGERNHTFLLMAMMILEVGFRRHVDQSAELPLTSNRESDRRHVVVK